MITDLPTDLLEFLRAGSQLEYDHGTSSIGHITLKREAELALTTIEAYPGCQSIIDDPYFRLDGLYQIQIYDLVATSDDYSIKGLLCWIVALKQFGCIDPEHGDVISFPAVTWSELVANPLPYLDAQWIDNGGVAMHHLPWLHFPFHLRQTGDLIAPYGPTCSLHGASMAQRSRKPPLFRILQKREMDDWLRNYLTIFPCSGVPINTDEIVCWSKCRMAEDGWIHQIDAAIEIADVTPNSQGWVKCPGCGIRFSLNDYDRFANGRHLTCGQKLRVVGRQ